MWEWRAFSTCYPYLHELIWTPSQGKRAVLRPSLISPLVQATISFRNQTKRNEMKQARSLIYLWSLEVNVGKVSVRETWQGNRCSGNGTREKGSRKRIDEIGNAGIREENPCWGGKWLNSPSYENYEALWEISWACGDNNSNDDGNHQLPLLEAHPSYFHIPFPSFLE